MFAIGNFEIAIGNFIEDTTNIITAIGNITDDTNIIADGDHYGSYLHRGHKKTCRGPAGSKNLI